ncbi:MAG: cysteine--tRNA ligase [Peptococcaceae bacterium]|nr:cysteine--tRNA ligase [Peptococcaceae bacterium]
MSEINVYNTMTGTKEPLITREPGKVGMYCCGPTTYNLIHLGNARPLVVFDTIRRYLTYKGYQVTFIQNFTDVDDKIINRAREEGQEPQALARHYIEEYFKDADALNVQRATVHPKVSDHMQDIIDFVKSLEDKGLAYQLEGDVYYSVSKFKDYGKLSKRNREDLLDGARVGVDSRKRDAADFALWTKAKPGEPSWESPWGKGRPGWHIECSAMSNKYLGESFDIHGGGFDLIFPHHENEIAQSEGRFGKTMARYWVHNGFITINHEKMSKSLGNFFLLREILEKFSGQVIRFYLLSVHYRSPLDFDDEKLSVAEKGLERLKNAARLSREALAAGQGEAGAAKAAEGAGAGESAAGGEAGSTKATGNGEAAGPRDTAEKNAAFQREIAGAKARFEEAMDDDFNTALAIAALFDMARSLNSYGGGAPVQKDALATGLETFLKLAAVLGLCLEEEGAEDQQLNGALAALLTSLGSSAEGEEGMEALMEKLLALRQQSRQARDFAKADKIRDGLKALGILVEDSAQGSRWRRG